MLPQARAVLLAYVTNRQLWWVLGWITLMTLPGLAMGSNAHDPARAGFLAMQLIAFPVGGCVFILNTQAKWQFCHPRSRLMPRFAGPHLAALLAIAIVFIAGLPILLSRWNLNPLGAASCAVALATPFLWASHSGWPLANLLALAQFFSLYNQRVADFWLLRDNASSNFPIHVAILVVGWAALAAWLWRLTQLREDGDDYSIPLQAQAGSATRMERTIASRAVIRQFLKSPPTRWISDRWHDRLTNVSATSTAARQCLLRYGFAATPAVLSALWMALMFFGILWMISQSALSARGAAPGSLLPSFNFFVIMPCLATVGMLVMRRARMPQELLLPLTRRQYVDGLLKVLSANATVAWLTVHTALLALVAVLDPTWLTWSIACALTALSLGVQVYAFGAMTRAAQVQQGGKRNVVMLVVLIPAFIAVGVGLNALHGPTTSRDEEDKQIHEQVEIWNESLRPEQIAELEGRLRRQADQKWEADQPRPTVAWISGATMAVLGAALIFNSRQKWLDLELG